MKDTIKNGCKNGLLPFLVMFVTMGLSIVVFRLFRAMNGTEIQPVMDVAGEETNPTIGRLIYMCLAFAASITLTAIAAHKIRTDKDKLMLPWVLGVTSGTMMWQSLGESSWHYGLHILNDEGEAAFVNFPRIESMQGLPFLILLMIFVTVLIIKHELNFGIAAFFMSFIGNWFGHACMIGTYPIALMFNEQMPMVTWYRISGGVVAAITAVIGIWLAFSGKTERQTKYLSSIFFFIAYGCLLYGVILGET